jgi:hypothetical protein
MDEASAGRGGMLWKATHEPTLKPIPTGSVDIGVILA